MVIAEGEKIHIITRRQFEGDLRRHFAGIVQKVSGSLLRARGFVFVFDESAGEFIRRDDERVRVFPVSDSGVIINILPSETDLANLRYEVDDQGRRVVTDGKSTTLNISEFGAKR